LFAIQRKESMTCLLHKNCHQINMLDFVYILLKLYHLWNSTLSQGLSCVLKQLYTYYTPFWKNKPGGEGGWRGVKAWAKNSAHRFPRFREPAWPGNWRPHVAGDAPRFHDHISRTKLPILAKFSGHLYKIILQRDVKLHRNWWEWKEIKTVFLSNLDNVHRIIPHLD
jgi:hypothetical protein